LAWVTAYYADAGNLIVTTGRFPNLVLENGGRALNRGIELNIRWQAWRRVSFTSGYACLRSTNLLPYVPGHKLDYSLHFDAGRILINLGGTLVGRTWAEASRTQQLGGYSVVTLKWTAPIGRAVRAFVTIDNLLNRRYQVVAGYPMPGINAMGGLSVSFR
jgi:outer membrane cobalamin receptor